MEDIEFSTPKLPFKVNQIICLEHQDTCLYGEVIQLIPRRGLCWFRPICMTKICLNQSQELTNKELIHLHSSSDLLWPMTLFRPALDTEVISLLYGSDDVAKTTEYPSYSRQYFNQFVQQVWQANQDMF